MYTIFRIDPPAASVAKIADLVGSSEGPLLLPLDSHAVGELRASEVIDVPAPLFADATPLREVVDAVVYMGKTRASAVQVHTQDAPDPEYEAEKQRRRTLIRPRQPSVH